MTSALGHFCVFSAPAVSNSIFFLREVCLFTKRPERNPYPGWPATKLQWNAERWKRDWSCHSPHPSYKRRHILIICHSNRCAREIRGEKGINRSEHRQSWSGMGRFNGFISVCVCVCEMFAMCFDMYPHTECMCQGDEQELVGPLMACLLITRRVG